MKLMVKQIVFGKLQTDNSLNSNNDEIKDVLLLTHRSWTTSMVKDTTVRMVVMVVLMQKEILIILMMVHLHYQISMIIVKKKMETIILFTTMDESILDDGFDQDEESTERVYVNGCKTAPKVQYFAGSEY